MANKWKFKVFRATDTTTLDEIYPSQSFASDETMRVGNTVSSSLISGGPYQTISLVKFGTWASESAYVHASLRIRAANVQYRDFSTNSLTVGFISRSTETFINGRGRRDSVPATNRGTTWAFSNSKNATAWSANGFPTQSNTDHVTSFTVSESSDIDVNVSLAYGQSSYHNGTMDCISIHNQFGDVPGTPLNTGTIEFYSAETHTIYQPELWVYKSVLSSGTAWPAGVSVDGTIDLTDDVIIYNTNLKHKYNYGNVPTFRVNVRPRYETPSYGTSSDTPTVWYLPSGSTFNFKDVASGDLVIPEVFESSSQYGAAMEFEADTKGHFIKDLPDNMFFPNRLYQIVVNVRSASYYETFVLPETFKFEL